MRKHGVDAGAKLEIMQKNAQLATAPEDNEHDSFADLDKDEEELENSEIVIENNTEADGTTVWLANLVHTMYQYIQVD